MRNSFFIFLLLISVSALAQTKISGFVTDTDRASVPFANVVFKDSFEGTITNEEGRFYLESNQDYTNVVVSFLGFQNKEIILDKKINYNMNVVLEQEAASLDEVVIFSGKTSKKNNPAITILRKIWDNRRQNGIKKFEQYAYDKYEKLEFDLNTIDSTLTKNKIFKGMEFIFEEIDTSKVTGNTYLPIFINEAFSQVYGDNLLGKERQVLQGNKNSGFENNNTLTFNEDFNHSTRIKFIIGGTVLYNFQINHPKLIPIIGTSCPFTISAALRIVPSPPRTMTAEISEITSIALLPTNKSGWFETTSTSFFKNSAAKLFANLIAAARVG